jgi:hypothetical protein
MRVLKVLEIEDDSDCATCTARHAAEWDLLTSVRCKLLQRVTCQECYRSISIFVVDEDRYEEAEDDDRWQ